MTKSLREVLKERDKCTDAEEVFEDFFGLEVDYLLETLF